MKSLIFTGSSLFFEKKKEGQDVVEVEDSKLVSNLQSGRNTQHSQVVSGSSKHLQVHGVSRYPPLLLYSCSLRTSSFFVAGRCIGVTL